MLKYILNYDRENPIEIYLNTDNIDEADKICDLIINREIDCYKISEQDKQKVEK